MWYTWTLLPGNQQLRDQVGASPAAALGPHTGVSLSRASKQERLSTFSQWIPTNPPGSMGNSYSSTGLNRAVYKVLKKARRISHKTIGTCQKGKNQQGYHVLWCCVVCQFNYLNRLMRRLRSVVLHTVLKCKLAMVTQTMNILNDILNDILIYSTIL